MIIYKPQIFSYGILLLLMIVVGDICYWLHPVVNPHMRRVTELKSENVNWRVKVFLFCAFVQIYEFQYYTLPVGYLIE